MRPLHILSYNVWGLASRTRRVKARVLLENLQQTPDILCLQEHKLLAGKSDGIKREVWRLAHWIHAPAHEGVHARHNGLVKAGRGGVSLGIYLDFLPFITKEGRVDCGRAALAFIDHPAWGRLGFVGLYGPNDSDSRTVLWTELTQTLDPTYSWSLLDDITSTWLFIRGTRKGVRNALLGVGKSMHGPVWSVNFLLLTISIPLLANFASAGITRGYTGTTLRTSILPILDLEYSSDLTGSIPYPGHFRWQPHHEFSWALHFQTTPRCSPHLSW